MLEGILNRWSFTTTLSGFLGTQEIGTWIQEIGTRAQVLGI